MLLNNAETKELRKVFHEGDQILSDRTYNLIIGAVIFWGFFVNAFIIVFYTDVFLYMDPMVLLVGYFICAIVGIIINKASHNPVISFIGYNLLVVPLGAVLSVILTGYDGVSVFNTVVVTGAVTAIMLILSILYPQVFLNMGTTLFVALAAVIIMELICNLFFHTDPTFFDWAAALIFCGYIGYDWARAQQYQRTVDNAIDSAFDIYLDIINLFLRLLRLFGKRNND